MLLCGEASCSAYNKTQTSIPWLINPYMISPILSSTHLCPYPPGDLRPFAVTVSSMGSVLALILSRVAPFCHSRETSWSPAQRYLLTTSPKQSQISLTLSGTEFAIPYFFFIFYLLLLERKLPLSRYHMCLVHFSKIIHKLIHPGLREFMLPN